MGVSVERDPREREQRGRQGTIVVCPHCWIRMKAVSSRVLFTYYQCERCRQTKKVLRPLV